MIMAASNLRLCMACLMSTSPEKLPSLRPVISHWASQEWQKSVISCNIVQQRIHRVDLNQTSRNQLYRIPELFTSL